MLTTKQLHAPVTQFLAELELELKQQPGVVPEDALCDAREYLEQDARSLELSEPGISDDQVYQHFLQSYGRPKTIAQQYSDITQPILLPLPGYAPGWRICCTRCGRSAPAAKAGITRIGAVSKHKYVVGWCRDCGWFRWMRIQQDLATANLTDELGTTTTATELRTKSHQPWEVLSLILVTTAAILLLAKMSIDLIK